MPLEQHPVPQHIASYEFRLIGDMTLKQFGFLAGGFIIGLVIYSLPLPGWVEWPLILLSVFWGFAFAFIPVEEKPLSIWIISFIKAIFAPTLYVWQKSPPLPEKSVSPSKAAKKAPRAAKKKAAKKASRAERKASRAAKKASAAIQAVPLPVQKVSPVVTKPPSPPQAAVLPSAKVASKADLPSDLPLAKKETDFLNNLDKTFKEAKPVSLAPPQKVVPPVFLSDKAHQLGIPGLHLQPNILVGVVLTKEGNLVEGAILEIRNEKEIPVRALKTNQLGRFLIATPLPDGVYEVEAEKEGLSFDIIRIEAQGKPIKPIEVRAK